MPDCRKAMREVDAMWDAIAIHPTSDCKKQCPFCYTKGLGPDKPAIFFKNILGLCEKVPAWYFACNWVDANTWREIAGLLREALASGHPYALTTNYQEFATAGPEFSRARNMLP